MKFTKSQISELREYAFFCHRNGYIDDEELHHMVVKRDWKRIHELRARADYYANSYVEEE